MCAAACGLALAATGCAASHPASTATPAGSGAAAGAGGTATTHGCSRQRLLAAITKHPCTTRTARATPVNAQVGAVFTHDATGDHFCTASV
ncbi:hypothetical protein, partial [Saccharothrix sp. ST-888]|uniref:hypothetical protein n=1 Tax=Saccharothrix sp. ST-888 TaxID=1427391 RepID=UPI0005ECA55C